jgi:hypothetical protein
MEDMVKVDVRIVYAEPKQLTAKTHRTEDSLVGIGPRTLPQHLIEKFQVDALEFFSNWFGVHDPDTD